MNSGGRLVARVLANKPVLGIVAVAATTTQIIAFVLGSRSAFADDVGYLNLADGLRDGVFSSWFQLDNPPPDTLRTPGYPIFLAGIRALTESVTAIKIVQFVLLLLTFFAVIRFLRTRTNPSIRCDRSRELIFAILLAPALQLAYRSGQINADVPTACAVTMWGLSIARALQPTAQPSAQSPAKRGGFNSRAAIAIGFWGAVSYLLRPAFIIVIFATAAVAVVVKRVRRECTLASLISALACAAFGMWSLSATGTFRIFPLEGGAGAAHLGYWEYRLPNGFQDRFYWNPVFEHDPYLDLAATTVYPASEHTQATKSYNDEWTKIQNELDRNQSANDKATIAEMGKLQLQQFVVHDTEYTALREKLLWNAVIGHATEEPAKYIATRIASLPRWWFTGWDKAIRTEQYACVSSFIGTFLPLCWLVSRLIRRKWRATLPSYVVVWLITSLVFTAAHTIFVVASRYTLPFQLLVFAAFAETAWARKSDLAI